MKLQVDNAVIESVLNCMDKPAIFIDTDYVIHAVNNAYRKSFDVKVVAGSSRCHQISHGLELPCDQYGEACPLSACRKTKMSQKVVHIHKNDSGNAYCEVNMHPIRNHTDSIVGYLEILETVITQTA